METHALHTDTLLTKRIMRRIYLLWAIRMALSPLFLKALIIGVFFWRSTKYVSYVHVFENMSAITNVGAGYQFFRSAMFHAHPMTLVLLSSVLWLTVWMLYDMLTRKNEAWF